MMSLLLRGYIKVHRIDDAASSPDATANRFAQYDENYLIEFIRHDAISQHISDFIEEAFERDYNYFAGLMEEIYWGVEAELVEEAYQFRRARLNDRGFPDFFEAQSVFAYLKPEQFLKIRTEYEPPSRADLPDDTEVIAPEMAPAIADGDVSLFNTALTAGFAAQGKRQLRSEMAMVSNQVLVARAVDFGDLEAVRVAVEMTHHYLNLALEHLAGGDLQSTIDLRTSAEATLRKLGLSTVKVREISYLDSPYREALAGFMARQPRFYSGLDGSGAVEMRDFSSMRDLHLSYAILDQVDSAAELFRAMFAIDIASPNFRAQMAAREIRLSQLVLTGLARLALDNRLAIDPIEGSRLTAMRAAIMTGQPGTLNDEFRAKVHQALAERLDDAARRRTADFLNSCLNLLEEEFANLGGEREIDPRFIESVLVRQG
jgi:hypothetical protein